MATPSHYEDLGCLHEWFARECPKYYDNVAVYFEGAEQTYRQLDRDSSLVAAWLQKEAEIQVGDLGMCVQRLMQPPQLQ